MLLFVCNQSPTGPGYVGGMLVTSSANGPAAIEPSDLNLFGIHETSFTAVRLWTVLFYDLLKPVSKSAAILATPWP